MRQDSKKTLSGKSTAFRRYFHVFIGIKYTKETFSQNEVDYRPTFVTPLKYCLKAMIVISVYHNIVKGAITEDISL